MKFKLPAPKKESNPEYTKGPRVTKIKKNTFWRDDRFIYSIIGLVTLFLFVFSYLDVKVLTTIHSYTIGAIFGNGSFFVYASIILYSAMKIFDWDGKWNFKIFHFSFMRFIILAFAITIFAGVIYTVKTYPKILHAGNHFNDVFGAWFKDYSHVKDAALPAKFTAGLLATLFFSIFSSIGSQILSIIIALIFLIVSIIIFFLSDIRLKMFSFSRSKRMKAQSAAVRMHQKSVAGYRPMYLNKPPEPVIANVNSKTLNLELDEDKETPTKNELSDFGNNSIKKPKPDYSKTSKPKKPTLNTPVSELDENPFDTTEFEINEVLEKNNIIIPDYEPTNTQIPAKNTEFTAGAFEIPTKPIEQTPVSEPTKKDLEPAADIFVLDEEEEQQTVTESEQTQQKRRFSLVDDEEDFGLN